MNKTMEQKKVGVYRVAFIFLGGIKPRSESQPELALQLVVRQELVGRHASRQQAAVLSQLRNITDKAQ